MEIQMVLFIIIFHRIIQQRFDVQHCIFVRDDLAFRFDVIFVLDSSIKHFAEIIGRWHLMFIACNDHIFPFQDRRKIVFQLQLTSFIKNDIIKIEILPLKKITASIWRRQNNGKEMGEKVNIFLNDLSQSQPFVVDTASFVIQICDCTVFVILLKLLHRILLGNVPKKLHKTLLRNP